MIIKNIKVGYLQTNCYILIKDNKCIVIDPGDEVYKIESVIGNNKLVGIIVTHYHEDHIGALEELKESHNVPVYDRGNLEEGMNSIDNFNFEVLYTPGHRNDSITIIFREYHSMFTGDFLFKGSIGRTDLETGNDIEMQESINKIKEYSSNYRVYPGHGDTTTLLDEFNNNIFLR
ncbi:MAG: MBL fold metallo-hydrolase [Bacilli bacterium]|nr:MBL fold metallo-hydrolase [Bacilli bacterium]